MTMPRYTTPRTAHCDGGASNGWRTSSYCTGGECIEAGSGSSVIAVRDRALSSSPVLTFPAAAWQRFTAGLKAA